MLKMFKNQKGFTLIELLIVIGLLGALTALVLPSLMADRTAALEVVCDYNQAGTIRSLHTYESFTGSYPPGFHTGLTTASTPDFMDMPEATADGNPGTTAGATLTANEYQSLAAAGITTLASGEGYQIESTTGTAVEIIECTDQFANDSGVAGSATFDGRTVDMWMQTDEDGDAGDGSPDNGTVLMLFVAPTINWEDADTNAGGWGIDANIEVGIDLEGECPIPADSAFVYYIAYFKAYDIAANSDGEYTAAKLLGTSCPECGITNP